MSEYSRELRKALDVADDMLDILNQSLVDSIEFTLHGVEVAYDEELERQVHLVVVKVVDNRD